MKKQEKLKAFTAEMKKGYQLVKEKKDHEALEKLKPFIALHLKGEVENVRLFVNYCIAQLRTGDIEGLCLHTKS